MSNVEHAREKTTAEAYRDFEEAWLRLVLELAYFLKVDKLCESLVRCIRFVEERSGR